MKRVRFELPARPRLRGRRAELATLEAALGRGRLSRLALVGGGGSGKSVLAAALAHRLRARFPGGAAWFRVGNWDHRTLLQMVALALGGPGRGVAPKRRGGVTGRGGAAVSPSSLLEMGTEPLADSVRAGLAARGPTLIVLDNHENDRAMTRFLDALEGTSASWLLTARRCLLSGVAIFPVVAPLVQARRDAFPSVRALTSLLRWNPLALDIADALVTTGGTTAPALRAWLVSQGVERVRVMAHEDDVAEVRLLVEWAWARLAPPARRMLTVLAHSPGDHMDARSVATLARVPGGGAAALGALRRWRLVQEPARGRFALHAVVRHALAPKAELPADRYFAHYVALLERHPERFAIEQSHVFAAMDHAQAASSLGKILRVAALLDR